ncbi:MAG: EamA family transporter [Erysipelotrichales bacterium]|nr:EamA family transporter [Erysipelotrichales bacterium]
MEHENLKSKIMLIISMVIFGTIGIFRKHIPLSSSMLAMSRGFIGSIFLLVYISIKGQKISFESIKRNLITLLITGCCLGFNWILLFEAYEYTTVATATLCYYLAPIFVIMVSPILFKEKMNLKKAICVLVALIGMVFVSGVVTSGFNGISELKGVLLGVSAAVLYATVVILNKRTKDIDAYERTIIQLFTAAIVLAPYNLVNESISFTNLLPMTIFMLILVGIIHTGIAYALYFSSMKGLKAQTIALYSYIDPIVAILLSTLLLHEPMSIFEVIGAIMILSATMISELTND